MEWKRSMQFKEKEQYVKGKNREKGDERKTKLASIDRCYEGNKENVKDRGGKKGKGAGKKVAVKTR